MKNSLTAEDFEFLRTSWGFESALNTESMFEQKSW